MLNEFKELEAYVTNPTSTSPRIQPKLLTGLFDDKCYLIGIEHIMTLIARAYIFSQENMKKGQLIEEQNYVVIELLHRWTGFADTEVRKRTQNPNLEQWMSDNGVVDNWLKEFWMFQFNYIQAQKKTKRPKEELWSLLEKKWNKRLNSPFDYMVNKFNYNNIVANALENGPLQNRYLAFKKDNSSDELLNFKYLFDKSSRQVTSDMKIIKLVAMVLLKKEGQPSEQNEVWIQNSELGAWLGLDDSNNGKGTWYQSDAYWNNKPIYTCRKLIGNTTKVTIDDEYIEKFDFRIIGKGEVERYKATHWILEDVGHGLKNCWRIKNKTPVEIAG